MARFWCAAALAASLFVSAAQAAPNRPGQVIVRTLAPVTILVLPEKGAFDKYADAMAELMTYVVSEDLMRGSPFGIYYDDPQTVPADSMRWDVAVPVPPGTKAPKPFEVRIQPEMLAATISCTGPYSGAGPCYAALSDWIARNGYVVNGPVQEHWLSDAETKPEKMQSQIIFPVRSLRPR